MTQSKPTLPVGIVTGHGAIRAKKRLAAHVAAHSTPLPPMPVTRQMRRRAFRVAEARELHARKLAFAGGKGGMAVVA